MKKKYYLPLALLLVSSNLFAQKKDFGFKFYGQVRADVFYNSRANKESADGLFDSYPLDKKEDPNGKDLNGYDNSGFYMYYSRAGVDVSGPSIGRKKVKTSAKLEVDFRGFSSNYSIFRIRHAYMNFDFGASKLLIGQTWHPFYGEVSPETLSLEMGAPFNPFSRAPQVRYRLNKKAFQLTASTLWQTQYLSVGLENKGTEEMIKRSCVPELHLGLDFKTKKWLVGAGVDMLSLKPRSQSTMSGETYVVNERITSVSAEAHVKYKNDKLYVGAKTTLGNNLTQTSTIGGFGVSSISNEKTGEREYTPLRISMTWLDISYGKTWRPSVFAGYIKNLGATKNVSDIYGNGTNIDQLIRLGSNITYNIPHWKFGAEYSYENAAYGNNTAKGKVENTHVIFNHRVMATAIFMF